MTMQIFHFFIIVSLIIFLTGTSSFAGGHNISDAEIVTVKSPVKISSVQKLPYYLGISAQTAGSSNLSMNMVVIPPGAQAEAHYHAGFESAVYVLQGQVETRYGKHLQKSVINETGDFILIPANVPHQPRNLSDTETAIAIVARNDPNEHESVVPYPVPTE